MYNIKRIPTDKNLVLDTDKVSIILPPRLIDIDIYKDDKQSTLSLNKLINVDYELSAYTGLNNKLSIYVDYNKQIKRELIKKHTKDNVIVLEYKDLFISVSDSLYNKDLDNLILKDNHNIDLGHTYNSKLVLIVKEV